MAEAARIALIVGVIPAAGKAARLQPLGGSKELLDVGGRPVIDYTIERLHAGGAEEIRVVTRPEKRDVVEHARRLGLVVVEGQPDTAAASVSMGLEGLAADDLVLVGLPDTLWEPVDGFARMLEELRPEDDVVLGVFPSPAPERSDVVELEDDSVVAVHIKVADPPGNHIWGIAAARRRALDGLGEHRELGEHFARLAKRGTVRAVVFPGELLDIGTAESLEHARSMRRQR